MHADFIMIMTVIYPLTGLGAGQPNGADHESNIQPLSTS